MSKKILILPLITIIILISLAVIQKTKAPPTSTPQSPTKVQIDDPTPKVISTNPQNLNFDTTLLPTQPIEITFNQKLTNDLTRMVFDPPVKFKYELSADAKTIKLIPLEAYKLDTKYTVTIKSGYAFQNDQKLPQDASFNFKTIKYNGV